MSTFSQRRVAPDSASFLAAARLVVALAALLLIGSSLPAITNDIPAPGQEQTLSVDAREIREILDSISGALPGDRSDQMSMAWEDLRSDLESVSRDIERSRATFDADGLVNRVETFRETYFAAGQDQNSEDWDQLVLLLSGLGGQASS
jgi:hypothetical protein